MPKSAQARIMLSQRLSCTSSTRTGSPALERCRDTGWSVMTERARHRPHQKDMVVALNLRVTMLIVRDLVTRPYHKLHGARRAPGTSPGSWLSPPASVQYPASLSRPLVVHAVHRVHDALDAKAQALADKVALCPLTTGPPAILSSCTGCTRRRTSWEDMPPSTRSQPPQQSSLTVCSRFLCMPTSDYS